LSKVAIRLGFLSANRRATLPFLNLPVPQVAILIKFLDCLRGIVVVEWLPLCPRFNHIVWFDSVTDQFGQFVQLTVNTMAFTMGVGPLFGTR
jgi:hypothetical protein